MVVLKESVIRDHQKKIDNVKKVKNYLHTIVEDMLSFNPLFLQQEEFEKSIMGLFEPFIEVLKAKGIYYSDIEIPNLDQTKQFMFKHVASVNQLFSLRRLHKQESTDLLQNMIQERKQIQMAYYEKTSEKPEFPSKPKKKQLQEPVAPEPLEEKPNPNDFKSFALYHSKYQAWLKKASEYSDVEKQYEIDRQNYLQLLATTENNYNFQLREYAKKKFEYDKWEKELVSLVEKFELKKKEIVEFAMEKEKEQEQFNKDIQMMIIDLKNIMAKELAPKITNDLESYLDLALVNIDLEYKSMKNAFVTKWKMDIWKSLEYLFHPNDDNNSFEKAISEFSDQMVILAEYIKQLFPSVGPAIPYFQWSFNKTVKQHKHLTKKEIGLDSFESHLAELRVAVDKYIEEIERMI